MDRKLNVLLMQLPVPNNPTLNTPLAAGYLKAYAYAQGLAGAVAIEVLPRALADYAGDARLVAAIVAERPDVLGVSLYTWNSERSLAVVRRVKERLPELLVVAGGPEVQKDNLWVLEHPAVDVAVVGEGEQTFVELLRLWCSPGRDAGLAIPLLGESSAASPLARIPGIAYRKAGALQLTSDRHALDDLAGIPSPYLSGYLDVPRDGMLMVEVSRWCPYSCSFCLYGKSMGSKLGNRYFSLERVLDEIRWADARDIRRVHFVEANLNLVPLFWPLMHALAELNAGHHMTFYAELRGEHLTEEVVEALDRANVRYVEVGLQTANPTALQASLRRTDLRKWAAGTRRLYAHNIEVYLDVILGLPADDEAGVLHTLDFIQGEELGPYDIFTLQVLPGTTVRQQAEQFGLRFQERPPYYVLGTSELGYSDLRRLRRDLKLRVRLAPDEVEGMPGPRRTALLPPGMGQAPPSCELVDQLWLLDAARVPPDEELVARLSAHVDVVVRAEDLRAATPWLAAAISHNPATIVDLYVDCRRRTCTADELRRWRAELPFEPGYLDRVAVYRAADPGPGYRRVSPRCFVLLPWTATVEPETFRDVAEVIWRYELLDGEEPPFGAWYAAGGGGIWLHFQERCDERYRQQTRDAVARWEQETGRRVWLASDVVVPGS